MPEQTELFTPEPTVVDLADEVLSEVEKVKAEAVKTSQRIKQILSDPIFTDFQKSRPKVEKLAKELGKLQDELPKLEKKIKRAMLPPFVEPTEDGFYILVRASESHWKKQVEVTQSLYLKGLGTWFDLAEGGDFQNGGRYAKPESLSDYLGIDEDTLAYSLIKYEGEGVPELDSELKLWDEQIARFKSGITEHEEESDEEGDEE